MHFFSWLTFLVSPTDWFHIIRDDFCFLIFIRAQESWTTPWLLSVGAAWISCSCRMHGELCYMKDRKADRKTHVALWGAEQIVEEDGTPPVHPVDALPDTDTSPGLFVTFILKQRACETHRGEAAEHMDQLISQIVLADATLVIKVAIQQNCSCDI